MTAKAEFQNHKILRSYGMSVIGLSDCSGVQLS